MNLNLGEIYRYRMTKIEDQTKNKIDRNKIKEIKITKNPRSIILIRWNSQKLKYLKINRMNMIMEIGKQNFIINRFKSLLIQ